MKRTLPALILAAELLLLTAGGCGPDRPQPPGAGALPDSSSTAPPDEPADPSVAPLRQLSVVLYFPAAGEDGLRGETHEIFETATPGDLAKQIVADLISGPDGDELLRALPADTRLRQVYVLDNGVAYVDFSEELKQGIGGGSQEELLAVYSIIDSVALNVPAIKRVGILLGGEPIETLNGHMDLRRPLRPDRSWILDGGKAEGHAAIAAAGATSGGE